MANPKSTTKQTTAAPAPVTDEIAISKSITMPSVPVSGRGSHSKYPFDSLETGACFGLVGKTAKSIASVVSNQNKKHRVARKDETGNVVYETKELKNADGTSTKVPNTDKPVFEVTKHFFAINVDSLDDERKAQVKKDPALKNASVLVFRDI